MSELKDPAALALKIISRIPRQVVQVQLLCSYFAFHAVGTQLNAD
jgi:hypothetical protein